MSSNGPLATETSPASAAAEAVIPTGSPRRVTFTSYADVQRARLVAESSHGTNTRGLAQSGNTSPSRKSSLSGK